jgi:sugar/nucleoside kinase (ribokinase family)
MLDILLPSTYFCDLVFAGLPEIPKLGDEVFCRDLKVIPGGGFIPSVALNRLGLQVNWACDFGNDFFSRYERAFLSYIDPLPSIDLPALIRQNPAKYLLFMSLQYGPGFVDIIQSAREQGSLVFMECQAPHGASLDDPEIISALRSVDIFAPNQDEALRLTGETDVESALYRLAQFTPTVVIKLGAEGAIARREGKQVRVDGLTVSVVDTTGAGDNFDCGFLYGLLRHYSLEDCLRCGNFCGGISTTASGGWEASPTAAQLELWLAKQFE